MSFFVNIFPSFEAGIANAIPASNEWKIETCIAAQLECWERIIYILSVVDIEGELPAFRLPSKQRNIDPVLFLSWASAVDDCPTLNQHWIYVSYLPGTRK